MIIFTRVIFIAHFHQSCIGVESSASHVGRTSAEHFSALALDDKGRTLRRHALLIPNGSQTFSRTSENDTAFGGSTSTTGLKATKNEESNSTGDAVHAGVIDKSQISANSTSDAVSKGSAQTEGVNDTDIQKENARTPRRASRIAAIVALHPPKFHFMLKLLRQWQNCSSEERISRILC
jgi:hypothetical protein